MAEYSDGDAYEYAYDEVGNHEATTTTGGTVTYTYDAVKTANDLAGLPVWVHASTDPEFSFLTTALQNVDADFNVADYHNYYVYHNETTRATQSYNLLTTHNSDGTVERLWNSEMGTYLESYNTFSMAHTLIDSVYKMFIFDETIASDAYCWGLNAEGQLGDSSKSRVPSVFTGSSPSLDAVSFLLSQSTM